jgi:hypothetical protein
MGSNRQTSGGDFLANSEKSGLFIEFSQTSPSVLANTGKRLAKTQTSQTSPDFQEGISVSEQSSYDRGLADGLCIAASLVRAGASPDEIAGLLDIDPGRVDPRGYSDRLNELAAILDVDGLFSGADR